MATPVVSSAAAILIGKEPALTPDQVKARLMKTASKSFPVSSTVTDPVTGQIYISYYDIFAVGAGGLDVGAALNNTDVASGSAASPAAVYDSSTGAVSLVSVSGVVWGTSGSGVGDLRIQTFGDN
jgi:serine protease AprX